ncbi:MAG: DUF4124 domain-containing protein [Dyella sp.]
MHASSPILWLLFCLPLAAQAQLPINRCLSVDGNPVFTDRTCASLRAVPVAPAKAVMPNVGEGGKPTDLSPHTCAASVGELEQGLLDAFASRNANRLSGLMLWHGYPHSAVIADIRALQNLLRQPLLGIAVDASADALIVSTPTAAADRQPQQTRFPIQRQSGCLWLRAD